MVLEYRNFTLKDKVVFEKVKMQPPFQPPSNFPNEACFLYVLEGGQRTLTPTERLVHKKNDAILLKCGNYFSEWIKGAEYDYCEAIGVHLYPEILKAIYEREVPNFILQPNNSGRQVAQFANNQLIDAYIESMLFYFDNPSLVDDDLLVLKLKELILLLTKTEKAGSIIEIISNLFTPRTHQLKQVVETHLYSTVGLEKMAEFCNQSLSTFKREFQKVYGESPAKYLRTKKLERSKELLRMADHNIGDIAFQCGFSDVAHFSNTFKDHVGMSPSEYRLSQK